MQSKICVKVGGDPSEVLETLEISATFEVTLVVREDKTELVPTGFGFTMPHSVEERNELPQREWVTCGSLREAKLRPVFIADRVFDPLATRSCTNADHIAGSRP